MNERAAEPKTGHDLATGGLAQLIRERLGPDSGRRIGASHVAVLRVLIDFRGAPLPANAIHHGLEARGHAIKLSGVYRVLEALEEARMVECHWRISAGRPVRAFGVAADVPAGEGG